MCRELAEEPLADEILAEPGWDAPLRLLGALHYLTLAEAVDVWRSPREVLAERREWLRDFVATQGVQTNEVQRSWVLLPLFLEVARRTGAETFDVVELGPSAGLNLVWDRYGYRYAAGEWGDAGAPLVLAGEERAPVPAELLSLRPRVGRRVGVDAAPIDLTTDEGALLLKSFVWADQIERLERLEHAIDVLRSDPPELVRGDFVEVLPDVLAERSAGALTVVFETAAMGYVAKEGRDRVFAALDAAAHHAPLALVSSGSPRARGAAHWGLYVRVWPGPREHMAEASYHGSWIDWLAGA